MGIKKASTFFFTLFLSTTLLFSSASSAVPSSTSETCSTKLDVNAKLMPFDTSSLSCNTAWKAQDFILLYKESQPGIWNFVLSAPDSNAYISVGFSPTGKMVGSSAVAGWMKSSGIGMARQYQLNGETTDTCPPDMGNLNLVKDKTLIVSQSSRLYLAFQLNTTQPLSKLIYAVGPNGNLPGADNRLAEHQTMVTATINYASGQSSEEGSTSDPLRTSHGVLALFGWGVLMPIGILLARYGKGWDPAWFYSHICIQGLGFALGVAAIVTGFKLEDEEGAEVDTHKSIGIVILVLGTLQVMAFLARPDKSSKVRKYWNWYHHYVGRAAIAFAIANIFYGLSIAGEDNSWNIGYGVFLGVWVLVALVLEVRMCVKRN